MQIGSAGLQFGKQGRIIEGEGSQSLIDMRGRSAANEHAGYTWLMQRPREREVRRRVSRALAHFHQSFQASFGDGLKINGLMARGDREAGSCLQATEVFAGEKPCAQRTISDQSDALIGTERAQRGIDVANREIVVVLQIADAGQLSGRLLLQNDGKLSGGEIAGAEGADAT